jgi:hypothetical protein
MIRNLAHAGLVAALVSALVHSICHPMAEETPATKWMPRLEGFELTDQLGTTHTLTFPRDKPLVLAVADRRGAEQIEGWLAPFRQLSSSGVDIVGIASLDGVPKLFRSRVVRQLERRYPYPLLLDWEAQAARSLSCAKNQVNVFLLDHHGQLMHRQEGPASEAQLVQLNAAIDRLLNREPGHRAERPPGVESVGR